MPAPAKPRKRFATTDEEVASAQLHFDFLVPFQTKRFLTTAEVGACIGRGQSFVRALVDAGRLEAWGDSALGQIESLRISRRSVLVYIARTAKIKPQDFLDSFINTACALGAHERQRLLAALKLTLP